MTDLIGSTGLNEHKSDDENEEESNAAALQCLIDVKDCTNCMNDKMLALTCTPVAVSINKSMFVYVQTLLSTKDVKLILVNNPDKSFLIYLETILKQTF